MSDKQDGVSSFTRATVLDLISAGISLFVCPETGEKRQARECRENAYTEKKGRG